MVKGGEEQFKCRCGRVRNGGLSKSGAGILEFDKLCTSPVILSDLVKADRVKVYRSDRSVAMIFLHALKIGGGICMSIIPMVSIDSASEQFTLRRGAGGEREDYMNGRDHNHNNNK